MRGGEIITKISLMNILLEKYLILKNKIKDLSVTENVVDILSIQKKTKTRVDI